MKYRAVEERRLCLTLARSVGLNGKKVSRRCTYSLNYYVCIDIVFFLLNTKQCMNVTVIVVSVCKLVTGYGTSLYRDARYYMTPE